MPTTLSLEAHVVDIFGVETPFEHLYLVRTVTDADGKVVSEQVIRGGPGDQLELVVRANVDLALSEDARGKETLAERHHTPLDLGGRDPDAVWSIMVQHAQNIGAARLGYGYDIYDEGVGPDVNSNTVVSSTLHAVGIDLLSTLPAGISPGDVPLYERLDSVFVNDVIKGGAAPDLVYGGVGADYIHGGGGLDRVYGESGNDRLIGYAGDDRLVGGSGDDELRGGVGNDVLTGSSGHDVFVFNTRLNAATNVDTVRDFSVAADSFWLDNAVFTALGSVGRMDIGLYRTGPVARDADDRIIYDRATGNLAYDPDGTGAAAQTVFAHLKPDLKLTTADFYVI